MALYEKVLELCAKKGISVRRLELESGIRRGNICHWDTSVPSIEAVQKVADYFGVSIDYLMERTDEGYYIDYESMRLAQEMKDNPNIQILLDASRNVSPEDLQFVIDMVKRMQK